VRLVADSHIIHWYLNSPEALSETALAALGDAEDSEGISVSAITVPELWMAASRKRGATTIPRASYEIVRAALIDPDIALDVEPITPAVWRHFEVVSSEMSDPMDCLIVATARSLGVPLVTKDSKITQANVVDTIW
jgi:PIN domain nuclease of toxin-antitoxin system